MLLCRGDLVSVYLVYNNNVLYLLYVYGVCFSYLMVEFLFFNCFEYIDVIVYDFCWMYG